MRLSGVGVINLLCIACISSWSIISSQVRVRSPSFASKLCLFTFRAWYLTAFRSQQSGSSGSTMYTSTTVYLGRYFLIPFKVGYGHWAASASATLFGRAQYEVVVCVHPYTTDQYCKQSLAQFQTGGDQGTYIHPYTVKVPREQLGGYLH